MTEGLIIAGRKTGLKSLFYSVMPGAILVEENGVNHLRLLCPERALQLL